jgi:hypothetical protein
MQSEIGPAREGSEVARALFPKRAVRHRASPRKAARLKKGKNGARYSGRNGKVIGDQREMRGPWGEAAHAALSPFAKTFSTG